MTKRKTNEAFVRDLMRFSRRGALMQAFVMTALEKYADWCRHAQPETFDTPLLNGAAWIDCAQELRQRLDDFYGTSTPNRRAILTRLAAVGDRTLDADARRELRERDDLCQLLYEMNANDAQLDGYGVRDNLARAAWALEALEVFTDRTFGGDRPDTMAHDDLDSAIGDLICDVLHFARFVGLDADAIHTHARAMYDQELAEEPIEPEEVA